MIVWLRNNFQNYSVAVVVLLSVALGFSIAANYYSHPADSAIAAPAKQIAPSDVRNLFVDVADALNKSVVNIKSEKVVEQQNPFDFDFGPFAMPRGGGSEKQLQTATGSGVVIRADGYILTNDHVVGGADRVTVKLMDGREFEGKVTRDPDTDLALVKINATNLPVAEFADSDKVRVGEWAIALGNPFGLSHTVTVGVVSGLGREIAAPDENANQTKFIPDAIQTDAAINPGNSGGPLVNIDGKIIGINFMILSRSGGNQGVGFAVPANTAKFVVDRLISKGKVVRGFLGLIPDNLSPVMGDKLGVKKGALVQSVDKDSPSDKAGIRVKDVIIKIDGKDIKDALSLRKTVQAIEPGTKVDVVIVRDKKEQTLSVTIGQRQSGVSSDEGSADSGQGKLGVSVAALTEDIAKQLRIDPSTKGVVVKRVQPGGPADRAGIGQGDVITEVEDSPVTGVASFEKAVKKLKKGDVAIVVVLRGEVNRVIEVTVD